MINIEKVATELFNKIRSRFDTVQLKDEENKSTSDPKQARFFHFNYVTADGNKHGLLTISLNDAESTMKVEFSQGITKDFDQEQEQEWKDFIYNLRMFAMRNTIKTFDVRDISRKITKRDIDQVVTQNKPVTEGIQWSGTTRTSVQNFGPTRLIVRHSEAVDDQRPGSRSRKIESMFVETDQGERFKMPYNRLSLGRSMAQHLAHGGRVYDEAGEYIQGIAEEMNSLAFFVRNTRNRTFEDQETMGMVESAIERYRLLRDSLSKMSRTRGYQQFAETFHPSQNQEHDYDIDALKERFVKKMFDERLTAALPFVYRAYQQRQVGEQKYMDEFESWTDQVSEDNGVSDPDWESISKIMSEPIKAGYDGIDAYNALNIDSEELADLLQQAAQTQGPDADLRGVIDDWLMDNYPEYTSLVPVNNEPETAQPTQSNEPNTVEHIKRLAGLL